MQLVLNTVYRVGSPLQNLPYLYYEELKKDPRIGRGDSVLSRRHDRKRGLSRSSARLRITSNNDYAPGVRS